MSDLTELIERVKAATGPDREIDALLAKLEGWTFEKRKGDRFPYWRDGKPSRYEDGWAPRADLTRYTASVDAALALVERRLPGQWPLIIDTATSAMWATESHVEFSGSRIDLHRLPLAILAALLSAIEPTP